METKNNNKYHYNQEDQDKAYTKQCKFYGYSYRCPYEKVSYLGKNCWEQEFKTEKCKFQHNQTVKDAHYQYDKTLKNLTYKKEEIT